MGAISRTSNSKVWAKRLYTQNPLNCLGVQHLLGRDFVKKLPELVPDLDEKLSWHEEAREHFVLFQDRATDSQSVIIYPTIKSIHERLQLAERLGCGVSIWEIGQGLDYFYDLF